MSGLEGKGRHLGMPGRSQGARTRWGWRSDCGSPVSPPGSSQAVLEGATGHLRIGGGTGETGIGQYLQSAQTQCKGTHMWIHDNIRENTWPRACKKKWQCTREYPATCTWIHSHLHMDIHGHMNNETQLSICGYTVKCSWIHGR
jgi:hypothetical protein